MLVFKVKEVSVFGSVLLYLHILYEVEWFVYLVMFVLW